MSVLRALVPALLAGALFTAALPPVNQWWLAWFWLLPLIWQLWERPLPDDTKGRRVFLRGFFRGWLAGVFAFGGTLWWVGHVTVLGAVLLCLYLAIFPGVWSGFAARLRPRSPGHAALACTALALLWAGLEYLRGTLLTGFPWNGAAVPLVEMPGIRSLASWTGVTGLSALPVFFMTGLAAGWCLRHHRGVRGRAILLCSALGLPAVLTVALWERSPQPAGKVEVMLVQPNFPRVEPGEEPDVLTEEQERALREKWEREEDEKRDTLKALTLAGQQRAKTKPQLIVWPESGLPGLFHTKETFALFEELFASGSTAFLVGTDVRMPQDPDNPGDDIRNWLPQNCAALMHGNPRNHQLYAKVHLVPFGEYLPLRKELPFLEKWLGPLIPVNFSPGKEIGPLKVEGMDYQIIPLICFEDTIAPLARQFVRPEPQLIVNITNDNWFYQSNESAIHALNARWRCIELRRPMVRASLTGVTCVIDTEGRVTSEVPRWEPAILNAGVALPPGEMTFYAQHGDVFATLFGSAGLVLALTLILKRPRP